MQYVNVIHNIHVTNNSGSYKGEKRKNTERKVGRSEEEGKGERVCVMVEMAHPISSRL